MCRVFFLFISLFFHWILSRYCYIEYSFKVRASQHFILIFCLNTYPMNTYFMHTFLLCCFDTCRSFFLNTNKPSYEQFLNLLIQLSYCHHYIELSPDLVNLKQFWKFKWILEWQHLSNTPYSGKIHRNRYWDQVALRHLINSQFNKFNLEYKFECLVTWSNLL